MANDAIHLRDRLASAAHNAFSIPLRDAKRFAQGFVDGLSRERGGSPLYIGKRTSTDAEILADFNGRNHAEVCEKHGISKRTLQAKVRAAQQTGKKGE